MSTAISISMWQNSTCCKARSCIHRCDDTGLCTSPACKCPGTVLMAFLDALTKRFSDRMWYRCRSISKAAAAKQRHGLRARPRVRAASRVEWRWASRAVLRAPALGGLGQIWRPAARLAPSHGCPPPCSTPRSSSASSRPAGCSAITRNGGNTAAWEVGAYPANRYW